MIIADHDAATAGSIISKVANDIITSNDDNTYFYYLSAPPNTNQIWVDLVQSGRKDFVAANTIVDIMNGLGDPRVPYYFTTDDAGGYTGGIYGIGNNYASFSKPADRILAPDFEAILFDAAEGNFLLAEAVERGFISGDAATYYAAGIQASMDYWHADAGDYLTKPEVAYATAAGDWKQKIGTQKWLALYNRGFEAWTEWRRFDHPVLNVIPDPEFTYESIPLRFTYPAQEQTINAASYTAGAAAIGGDEVRTRLFWDHE
jgi:hypothetical protein